MSEQSKLWILKPNPKFINDDKPRDKSNPWYHWYDRAYGFVVRAKSETKARRIADRYAGCENHSSWEYGFHEYHEWTLRELEADGLKRPWLDPEMTTCEELTIDGKSGLILRDYHAG